MTSIDIVNGLCQFGKAQLYKMSIGFNVDMCEEPLQHILNTILSSTDSVHGRQIIWVKFNPGSAPWLGVVFDWWNVFNSWVLTFKRYLLSELKQLHWENIVYGYTVTNATKCIIGWQSNLLSSNLPPQKLQRNVNGNIWENKIVPPADS